MRSRAFTIIELMVSIGMIGLLLGILLPALAGARERAREAQSLANLHNLGITITAYTQLHKGAFPFPPRDPGGITGWGPVVWHPSGDRRSDGAIIVYIAGPWDAWAWWPALLHDVAPWNEHFESWISPGTRLDSRSDPAWSNAPVAVGYFYSNSFLGKPVIWSSSPASEADIGPIISDMVAHPSAKAIFFDAVRAYLRTITPTSPRPVLFVDGAASLRLDADATPPVRNQLTHFTPRLYHDTPWGVQGRDF